MSKKEHKKIKAKLMKMLSYWKMRLFLDAWDIDAYFCKSDKDYKKTAGKTSKGSVGLCSSRWEYMIAAIHFNCYRMRYMRDDQMRRIVVHELCHCVAALMRNSDDITLEEHMVSHLTSILLYEFKGQDLE